MSTKAGLLAFSVLVVSTLLAVAAAVERSDVFVKDGDTIIKGNAATKSTKDQEYRLVGFDTPETSWAKCPAEIEKGTRAAARLIALLNGGRSTSLKWRAHALQE